MTRVRQNCFKTLDSIIDSIKDPIERKKNANKVRSIRNDVDEYLKEIRVISSYNHYAQINLLVRKEFFRRVSDSALPERIKTFMKNVISALFKEEINKKAKINKGERC
jgi:hypothetical protein